MLRNIPRSVWATISDKFPHNSSLRGKEKTHKHKHIRGLAPGLSGSQNFVYVFFFPVVIPYGGEKHINKIPPKIPGQSREKFVYVFFLYVSDN